MREGPDVQAHHQRRRPFLGWQAGAERLYRFAQHGKGGVGGVAQLRVAVERDAGLEHRRVIGRLVAGESEVGAPELTPAQRAASAKVKPAGPLRAIRSSAASISASRRLPW